MLGACAAGRHSLAGLRPTAPASSRCPGLEGGVVLYPCAPAGLSRTPLRSPAVRKPRAGSTGSVREACADSPAITQRKENTTRRRINSSARGRASKQPLPNSTAPFPGQAWPHRDTARSPRFWAAALGAQPGCPPRLCHRGKWLFGPKLPEPSSGGDRDRDGDGASLSSLPSLRDSSPRAPSAAV